MIIRKKFKFEGAHIVRGCSSDRCKKSLHGHSYIVEVFFTSNKLDNGQMIYDFGLTKGTIRDIIDSFDHAYSAWDKETEDFMNFIKSNSDRYVIMPVSPSAEGYSLMLLYMIDKIMEATEMNNGEGSVRVKSVRVHETETGYAESFREDLDWFKFSLEDVQFSESIKEEWQNPKMYEQLIAYYKSDKAEKPFKNPVIVD